MDIKRRLTVLKSLDLVKHRKSHHRLNYLKLAFLIILMILAIVFFNSQLDDNQNQQLVVDDNSKNLRIQNKSQISESKNQTVDKSLDSELNFLKRYPNSFECKNKYNIWSPQLTDVNIDYSKEAPIEMHQVRVTRAVAVQFPIDRIEYYVYELKWLYRSWIQMIRFEPSNWRTDLVVFVQNEPSLFEKGSFFLNELNCRFDNIRTSDKDPPMCILVHYRSFSKRQFATQDEFRPIEQKYRHLLERINIFEINLDEFEMLYKLMKSELNDYAYLDSILIGFEGYEYFKSANYDFIMRSDMDAFLTPLFATWLPRHCNDFTVGGGAYSTDFNDKRLRRAAKGLGLEYTGVADLGSTWYSTPAQIRLVSYLTLIGMVYLALEEFTQVERAGKLGAALWPEWHYQVLSMYGHTLALNHLLASNHTNVVRLNNQIDVPSHISNSIYRVVHIHVFHCFTLFSKFDFKAGKYDDIVLRDDESMQTDDVKNYALMMALEAKRTPSWLLFEMLKKVISNKH